MLFLIGQPGFEPGTPSPPDLYANQLRYCPLYTARAVYTVILAKKRKRVNGEFLARAFLRWLFRRICPPP